LTLIIPGKKGLAVIFALIIIIPGLIAGSIVLSLAIFGFIAAIAIREDQKFKAYLKSKEP